jgi:hypothetical protein
MGHAAGLASGLLGALQMAMAALAATAAGLFADSLLGLAVVLAACAGLALACDQLARAPATRGAQGLSPAIGPG